MVFFDGLIGFFVKVKKRDGVGFWEAIGEMPLDC